MHKQIKNLYEFGPLHLDVGERLLMREGRVVPLSPKVFETLLVLVENNGRILGKDELMQTLWPDTFVEESNLTQNISQIRRALNDGTSDAQYIETIPKRGYRFIAEVQMLVAAEENVAFAVLDNGLNSDEGVEVVNILQDKGSARGSGGNDKAQPMAARPSAPDAAPAANH